MSALYLSKVVPQGSTHSSLKPARGQLSESEKRVKPAKMAEDYQKGKDDLSPPSSATHQPRPEDISGEHFPKSMPSQLLKEKLHQQRQKCELRRLLKHTHPELKMLDEVVDEEFAEVLRSETGLTAGETGYEGEVFSRRLIFENCALSNKVSCSTSKMHKAEGMVKRDDVSKTLAVFKEHEESPCNESDKGIVEDEKTLGSSPEPNRECEEEMIKVDVKATKRFFESKSMNTSKPYPDRFEAKVSLSGDETEAVQKQKPELEMCTKDNLHIKNKSNACSTSIGMTDQTNEQSTCVHTIGQSSDYEFSGREEVSTSETVFEGEPTSRSDPEECRKIIKTSASLFQNNPFIPTNIERESSFLQTSKSPAENSGATQDYPIANVKNRAHLFESMPFDKIRHQDKDEIEAMVENIKETLNSLYHVNAIHSDGSIIEVNETMIAKKAKFTLSESGPKIKYDEVAEGGVQNFLLQLLPRANLKSQITYLKEGSKGSMAATVVNIPVHQHHFTTNQETEFKTANVLQLLEDILNQDNSLRKGVIIQEDAHRCAEVVVYSLYNYFDEVDVKCYCLPQGAEYDEPELGRGDVSKANYQDLGKGVTESTISLLENPKDQTYQGSMRPEITVKGNVKLFKSCIEKGDLEYLKTLQDEPTVQEQDLPPNQNVAGQGLGLHYQHRGDQFEESNSEWVPVDIKRLKNIFSGEQRPTQLKKNVCENFALRNAMLAPQGSYIQLETQDDERVHQAELVEVVNDNDEISNLQTAIHSLRQATIEAKSLHHSSQEKQKILAQEPVFSVTSAHVKHLRTEAEIPQENEDHKRDECTETTWHELPSTSKHKSDCKHENTETCCEDNNSEEVQTIETCSKMDQKGPEVFQKYFQAPMVSVHSAETTNAQPDDEEVVFQGKLQAALDSLERSNINVSRGDFRAAMIYRSVSKPHKERSQNVDATSVHKLTKEKFCHVTEPKFTQAPLRHEVPKEQVTAANAVRPSQCETLNKPATSAVSEKSRRSVGQKPAIPPKPEHLIVKQRDNQSINTKNIEPTQTNTVKPKEIVPQLMAMTSMSCKDELKQGLFKINTGADSGPDLVEHQKNNLFDEATQMDNTIEVTHQVPGSVVILENHNSDKNIIKQQQEIKATADEKSPQDFPIEEDMNETDVSHVDFHEASKKFGGKKAFSTKNAPVKPKRVKITQPEHMSEDNSSIFIHVIEEAEPTLTVPSCNKLNFCRQAADGNDKHEKEIKKEGKVEMRGKKGRTETDDERRQRLSVHMDEILRGNITAAMDIFDHLRKQEELQSILSRVEEVEQDTSEVDVRSLRGVFENDPDWIVSSDRKKQKKTKVENKEERLPLTRDNREGKSPMAHVFGDLERASEEIMNLKEQTLARLMDIEEAIKKALYSVSTLKSDSDIAGLSCLFKESLGTEQGSPSFGSISKISIGSSRTKSLQTLENPTIQGDLALPVSQATMIEVAPAKQQASPPSSPAFISIQSAAKKTDEKYLSPTKTIICQTCQHNPKTEDKFRTTKTLTCNSPAQNRKRDPRKAGQKQSSYDPKLELSVLEVQTDSEGNSIMGTKTVTENYERTDDLGNRFYSSTTSTVVTAQPDTTTSTSPAVVSPAIYQATEYPEVLLPLNQKS
ncbi:xin actin-binding repeat-containing protein 1 isoform X2 [Etheostoma cragini]|nr:xin actin-binding repeat-containing protein 1 isoform X2 [Etheostoma cragini]